MVRPRREEQIDIARRAVEVTIEQIDQKGEEALTLAAVAADVGCRAPALYSHFASKDALLRAAHDEGFRMLLDGKMALAVRTKGDVLGRLREGGLAYLRFAFEHPGLYRLMFSPPGGGLFGNPFGEDAGRRCLDVLGAAVRGCQDEGYLADVDTDQMVFLLWSLVHGAAMLVLQGRAPLRTGEEPARAAERCVDAIMQVIANSREIHAA